MSEQKTNTEYFKKKLEAERDILREELSRYGIFDKKTKDWEAVPDQTDLTESDENTAADRFEDFEGRTALISALESRMTDVIDALKKIEKGEYGICEVSKGPIEEKRLVANPAARTCMAHMDH